jgi:hypothetical protein
VAALAAVELLPEDCPAVDEVVAAVEQMHGLGRAADGGERPAERRETLGVTAQQRLHRT